MKDGEIILLDNPATVRPGTELRCQVLREGRPVVTEVGAVFDGYSEEEDTYVSKTTTGPDGVAHVVITEPGLWMLRAALTEPVSDGSADKVNLRATYVFAVK